MFTAVLRKRLLALNPRIVIMEVSCKTRSGIESWINWLTREVEAFKGLK
jgi:hydrogenase nickel incorporation protein HypB